jgi:hypothetical protein
VLYRPDWLPRKMRGFRASSVTIDIHEGQTRVVETQDYPTEKPPYRQVDTGTVFFYGPKIYFLTREGRGECIKLFVITQKSHVDGLDTEVHSFHGYLFAASERGVFARARFYCVKYSEDAIPEFGRINLDEIPNDEVFLFLRDDDPSQRFE